jgi:hypothetical protein
MDWSAVKKGQRVVFQPRIQSGRTEKATAGTVLKKERDVLVIRYDGQRSETRMAEARWYVEHGWINPENVAAEIATDATE